MEFPWWIFFGTLVTFAVAVPVPVAPADFSPASLIPKFAQLPRIDIGGRLRHQVLAAIVFRERHHFADGFFAANQHHQSIETERDATVRRRAESERAKQMAEQHLLSSSLTPRTPNIFACNSGS